MSRRAATDGFAIEVDSDDHSSGRITIGSHDEAIAMTLGYWSEHDYKRQWWYACDRVSAGGKAGVFLVDVAGPWLSRAAMRSWVAYVDGDTACVQNILLFPRRRPLAGLWRPHRAIPRRQTHSGAHKISEWTVPVQAIRAFGDRLLSELPECQERPAR